MAFETIILISFTLSLLLIMLSKAPTQTKVLPVIVMAFVVYKVFSNGWYV